jgi:hypothetical protein
MICSAPACQNWARNGGLRYNARIDRRYWPLAEVMILSPLEVKQPKVSHRNLLLGALTLAATPLAAAVVAIALMWCVHQWNWPVWMAMLVGGGLFVGLTYGAWRSVRKLVQRRFQFGIRALLFGVAVVAILLSTLGRWWLNFAQQYGAFRSVNAYGGYVHDPGQFRGQPRRAVYSWIGYDPFEKDRDLELPNDRALFAVIERPTQFADFVQLSFHRGVTSAGFEHVDRLNQLTDLRCGEFMMSAIDGMGLRHLSGWTNVRELFFNGCKNVTDAGLAHLVELPNLEELSLVDEGDGMVITDAGLAHIGQMKRLKYLMLIGMPSVSDAGLVHLHGLSNLENMSIHRTGATEDGLKQLYAALPDCHILSSPVFARGPQNVRRIVVRKLGRPDKEIAEISDPARIADLLSLTETITKQDIFGCRDNDPWPADLRLDFMGQSRVLYEVRIGDGTLQENFRKRWNKWQLTNEQSSQLMELLEPVTGR